ncbi:hypothetical protein D3C71_1774180 [compost metagenome]
MAGGGLVEGQHAVVAAGRKGQAAVGLQRGIGVPDLVQAGDLGADVAGAVPVALAQLVLLGVQVFFLAGQGGALAEFEAAVHAPQAGSQRRQRRAYQKAGAPRGLQEEGVDVRRVHKEVRPEEVGRRRRGDLFQIGFQLRLLVAPGEIGV